MFVFNFYPKTVAGSLLCKLPLSIRLIMALLAGSVFALSLAPYHWWAVSLLSVGVLYVLLVSEICSKKAFWLGQAYGFGTWAVGAFWLYTSIHEYGFVPSWLALLMIGAMAFIMGLFHAFFAWIFVRWLNRTPLTFASLWVVQEWAKTWVLTGFPWLFVGYAFTEQSYLTGLAPVLGVLSISFVAVLASASVIEAFAKRYVFLAVSGLCVAVSVALGQIAWTKPTGKTLSVSLVQGNIPQDLKWLMEYRLETLEIYKKLSDGEWGQDIVVWPEAAIPMFHDEAQFFIDDMANQAQAKNTTWITGLLYRDLAQFDPASHAYPPIYNSVVSFENGAMDLYKKQRLVPFGEYIPFEGMLNILPDLAAGVMSISRGDDKQNPLMAKNHQIGSAICYEVAYPDTTRKNAQNSDFLLTISNDAWFGTSAGPLQHLQMVQMRSLETGRWFVRATNTGVTAFINEKGQIVKQAPQFERTVLRGQVPSFVGETPFVRFGHYPLLVVMAVLLALGVIQKRRNRQK